MVEDSALSQFVALSVVLTGYERLELYGTGLAELYLSTVTSAAGDATVSDLLATSTAILQQYGQSSPETVAQFRAQILASARLGPVSRNIIQLWYLGSWFQLPTGWRAEFGTFPADTTRVVSAEAYQQSLVYDAARAHPPGAKQPGYGSWAMPPIPAPEPVAGPEAQEKSA